MTDPPGKSTIAKNDAEMMALILLKGISPEGFENVYDDRDLAAVMTFIRNRRGGHDDYISEAQAAAWRAKYVDRTEPVSQAEIDAARQSAIR